MAYGGGDAGAGGSSVGPQGEGCPAATGAGRLGVGVRVREGVVKPH